MANKFWTHDTANKGRISLRAPTSTIKDEQIENVFGWGLPTSIWSNPCFFNSLVEFQGLKPSEMTERVGFLAWNKAAEQNKIKEVSFADANGNEIKYYSVCGYKELMPHMHNFSNTSKAIQLLEEHLIDELVFHLFSMKNKSLRGSGGLDNLGVFGYTIRFDELTVTPKDNLKDEKEVKVELPTNRVARGRIYGAILIPVGKVDEALPSSPWEVFTDPKKIPPPERKVIPKPVMPAFSEEELAEIEKLTKPVGQFGFSPEETRAEQLKLYSIAELRADANLAIPNPKNTYAAKLLQFQSKLPVERIVESLKERPKSQIVFYHQGTKSFFPANEQWEGGQVGKMATDGMFYISILTEIKHSVHQDPEFLYYDHEHDAVIERAVREIYYDALEQPQVLSEPDENGNQKILQPWRKVPKVPSTRDLVSLAEDIGYFRTDQIPDAIYKQGKDVDTWIITVGISYAQLYRSVNSEYPHPLNDIEFPELLTKPPVDKFDWLPKVGDDPWLVKIPETFQSFRKKGKKKHIRRGGGYLSARSYTKLKEFYYFAYESEHEYLSLIYDSERTHRERQKAVIQLYDKLSPAKLPDYRVRDFKIAPIPFSGKAAVLVAIRKEWADVAPFKVSGAAKELPPVVTPPKLANSPAPFLNWRTTFPPFPTWHDTTREKYFSIAEAPDYATYLNPDTAKPELERAKNELGAQVFKDMLGFYGKRDSPNANIDSIDYYKYFSEREFPPVRTEVWLSPKPYSSPRVIVGIEERFLKDMPPVSGVLSDREIIEVNKRFCEEEDYLLLKIPVADNKGFHSFARRMDVAKGVLYQHAKKIGAKKNAPNGMTQYELERAAKQVGNFLDDFYRTVVRPNNINIDASSNFAINNLREQHACEYYLYLDPKDYSVKDVFAFGRTRLTKGLSDFKALWEPPNCLAMQFVYWAGMTYIDTAQGRNSMDDLFSALGVLTDPFGALDGWLSELNMPGFPEGFSMQMLAEASAEAKAEPDKNKPLTAKQKKEKAKAAAEARKKMAKMMNAGVAYDKLNTDTSNPAASKDANAFLEGLSAAGCGEDLLINVLSQVNIFNLIQMYLKCLGLEMPVDPRCLFNAPFPMFDLNIVLPRIVIPDIDISDMLAIIRKMLYEILCALIIQILMMLVKEILEAVMALPGCENPDEGLPPMPDAPFDFGSIDPEDMIEDAMGDLFSDDPFEDLNTPDGFANNMFGMCQPGLKEEDYGAGRTALTYFKDVAKILSGVEFCKLMHGEASRDILQRVINFTKAEYPNLYFKEPLKTKETKVGRDPSRRGSEAEEKRKKNIREAYIGAPRPPGVPFAYRNFFMCLAAILKRQVNEVCDPEALVKKYGKPSEAEIIDDKCALGTFPERTSDLNDKLKEIYKDKGLTDEEIEDMLAKADAEIQNKLMDLDTIQQAIDEFLEVVVPKVTAPVVSSITMNAFDAMFKIVGIQMRTATERMKRDCWDANEDIPMMVNYVVNARNAQPVWVREWRLKWRWAGWAYSYLPYVWEGYKMGRDDDAEEPGDWSVVADPVFLDPKFRTKIQVWPDPDLPQWMQDILTFKDWFFGRIGPFYRTGVAPELQRTYRSIACPNEGTRSLLPPGMDYLERTHGWKYPRWYTSQNTLRFLYENTQQVGTLANVAPTFTHGKKGVDDKISEKLVVSNGKFAFSVTLNKNGTHFIYDLWREPYTLEIMEDIPEEEKENLSMPFGFGSTGPTKRLVEQEVERESVFGGPIEVDLSIVKKDEEKNEILPNYPWWHDRKVTSSDGWIQKDEFLERFVPSDHPLKSRTEWNGNDDEQGIGDSLFMELHDNFYVKEVQESVIEVIRRNPMKDFWLEEYYRAEDWEHFNLDLNQSLDSMARNKFFDPEDPYFKLSDIRQKAKEILENE